MGLSGSSSSPNNRPGHIWPKAAGAPGSSVQLTQPRVGRSMWRPADPWSDAMPDLQIEQQPPVVETQRVVPVVSLVSIGESAAGSGEWSAPQGVELGRLWTALRHPVARSAELIVALGIGVVAFVVSGDPRLGAGAAALVVAAASVRFVDRHVGFSFGEGFVGYRGDPAWPQGVQEDDDVRWDWGHGVSESGTSGGLKATRDSSHVK